MIVAFLMVYMLQLHHASCVLLLKSEVINSALECVIVVSFVNETLSS
jgi:hypothetical protein